MIGSKGRYLPILSPLNEKSTSHLRVLRSVPWVACSSILSTGIAEFGKLKALDPDTYSKGDLLTSWQCSDDLLKHARAGVTDG